VKAFTKLAFCFWVLSTASFAHAQTEAAKTEFKAASTEFNQTTRPGPRVNYPAVALGRDVHRELAVA